MCCNVPRQQYPRSSLRVSVVVGLFGGWFTWLLVVVFFFFLFLCYLLKTLSLWEVSFFNIFHLFIYSYLAASGLSGSMRDLQSLLWHAGYFSCSIWDLCNLKDCSPPGSSFHGILHARILKWVAIPFCRGSSQPRDWTQVSCLTGRFFTIWATKGEAPILWPPNRKSQLSGKRPWCWERLSAGEEVGNRGWDVLMASLTQWTWVWTNSGR